MHIMTSSISVLAIFLWCIFWWKQVCLWQLWKFVPSENFQLYNIIPKHHRALNTCINDFIRTYGACDIMSFWSHCEGWGCSCTKYRIARKFCGIKFSRFSRIRPVHENFNPRNYIYVILIMVIGLESVKIKSQKLSWMSFCENFTPQNLLAIQ